MGFAVSAQFFMYIMVPAIITIVAVIYIISEKSKLSRLNKSGNSKCWELTPEAKSLRKVNSTIALVAIVFSIATIVFGNFYTNSWIDYVFDGCKYSIEEVKSEIGYEGTSEELVNELLGFEVYAPNSSDNSGDNSSGNIISCEVAMTTKFDGDHMRNYIVLQLEDTAEFVDRINENWYEKYPEINESPRVSPNYRNGFDRLDYSNVSEHVYTNVFVNFDESIVYIPYSGEYRIAVDEFLSKHVWDNFEYSWFRENESQIHGIFLLGVIVACVVYLIATRKSRHAAKLEKQRRTQEAIMRMRQKQFENYVVQSREDK